MTSKGKKLEQDVIKVLKTYKSLQKDFDDREAQFRRALRLPDVEPQAGTGLHPMGGGAAKMKVVDQNRTRTIGLLAVVKDSMMRVRRELMKLIDVAEAGGTAAAGAREYVKDIQDSIVDADRRSILFAQLFAVAEVTNYVTEENAAEARAVEGACSWVQSCIQTLRMEIDVVEAAVDELRGRKARRDVTQHDHLVRVARAHKLHISRLELLARLLVRGDVTPEAADEVRQAICEYTADVEKTRAGHGQFADEDSLGASFDAYNSIDRMQEREEGDEDQEEDEGMSVSTAEVGSSSADVVSDVRSSNRRGSVSDKPSKLGTNAAASSSEKRSAHRPGAEKPGEQSRRMELAATQPVAAMVSAPAVATPSIFPPRQPPTPLPAAKWGDLNATLRLEAAALAANSSSSAGAMSAGASVSATLSSIGASSKLGLFANERSQHPVDDLPFDFDAARGLCWFSFGCADEACAFLHIGLSKCPSEAGDGATPCPWHLHRACRLLHADQERFVDRDRSGTIVRLRKGFPLAVCCSTDGGVPVALPPEQPQNIGLLPAAPAVLSYSGGAAGAAASQLGLRMLPPLPSDTDALTGALLAAESAGRGEASGGELRCSVGSSADSAVQDVAAACADCERASVAVFSAFAAGGPAPALLDSHDGDRDVQLHFPVELGLREYTRQLVSVFVRGLDARFAAAGGAAKAAKAAWVAGLSAEQCWDEQQLLRCCNMHRQSPEFLADLTGRSHSGSATELQPLERRTLSEGLAFFYNLRTWQAHSELGVSTILARSAFVITSVDALLSAAGVAIAVFAVVAAAESPTVRAATIPVLRGVVYLRSQIRAHFLSRALREGGHPATAAPQQNMRRTGCAGLADPSLTMVGFEFPQALSRPAAAAGDVLFLQGLSAASTTPPSVLFSKPADLSATDFYATGSLQLAEAPAQAFLRNHPAVYSWLRTMHAISRSGIMLCAPLVLDDSGIPFKDPATLMALVRHGFVAD